MKKSSTVEYLDGYRLIRSDRRTVSVEVGRDGNVTVRAPLKMRISEIAEFVGKHSEWIKAKQKLVSERADKPDISEERIAELKLIAAGKIPPRVEYWSQIAGLVPTGVKITRAKTRWGSCSPKNSLSFSCFLADRSDREIDYVVLHELAHIKEKNHGRNFYKIIGRYMPDYKDLIKKLKQ